MRITLEFVPGRPLNVYRTRNSLFSNFHTVFFWILFSNNEDFLGLKCSPRLEKFQSFLGSNFIILWLNLDLFWSCSI